MPYREETLSSNMVDPISPDYIAELFRAMFCISQYLTRERMLPLTIQKHLLPENVLQIDFFCFVFSQALLDTANSHVKYNRTCLEPCVRQLVQQIEELSVSTCFALLSFLSLFYFAHLGPVRSILRPKTPQKETYQAQHFSLINSQH